MNEEAEVLKEYVELLGLDRKTSLAKEDLSELRSTLKEAGEYGLADYVGKLEPEELEELISTTLS